jgi:hypothetical protein
MAGGRRGKCNQENPVDQTDRNALAVIHLFFLNVLVLSDIHKHLDHLIGMLSDLIAYSRCMWIQKKSDNLMTSQSNIGK